MTTDAAPAGLPNPAFVAVVAALATVTGLACWQTVIHAREMCCMLDGLVHVGHAMPFDANPVHFAGMWTVMMAAMMLPGIVPTAAAHAMQRNAFAGVVVASGYLTVWIATAAVAFATLTLLNQAEHPEAWLNRAGGLVVALAGAYQFTGWKRRLLDGYHPAQPRSGIGALGCGLSHGFRCLGASWALMSVLLVVGVMNLAWMAGIGAICLAEKIVARRVAVARGVGVALVAVGLAIVVSPPLLDTVALIA